MTLDAELRTHVGDFELQATLDVAQNETLGVVGPNGSGKTTLLRALAGLIALDRGSVRLDDRVLEDVDTRTRVPVGNRRIGFMFQDGCLFPHMSCKDNVAYGLRMRGEPRRSARAAAARLLGQAGLEEVSRARPGDLSGGQRQQIALLRALTPEPQLLLLDEPTASVDVVKRADLRRKIRERVARFGGPTLFVSHDALEVLSVADRILVLEGGRVVQCGSTDELASHPKSTFVAEVVGVNVVRGKASNGAVVTESGATLVGADEISGDVVAVFHPHSVALHLYAPEGSPRNNWPVTVSSVDRIPGGRLRVNLTGALALSAEITTASQRELDISPGTEVWATVKATEVSIQKA